MQLISCAIMNKCIHPAYVFWIDLSTLSVDTVVTGQPVQQTVLRRKKSEARSITFQSLIANTKQ